MMSSWVVAVGAELLSGGKVQVRAELSDGSFLQLTRTDEDLAQMMKRLVDGFPDDRETLSCRLLSGLLRVRAAELGSDHEVKVVEVNKLLKTIISLPHKFSQSEAVLAFFEPSAVDQTFREDKQEEHKPEKDHIFRPEGDQMLKQEKDQAIRMKEDGTIRQEGDQTTKQEEDQGFSVFQSPVARSEIMRSNGFCLANTETILFDLVPPTRDSTQSDDYMSRASAVPAVCLQSCHPSVSPLLRGFTGMMDRLVKRRSLKHRTVPPSCPPLST